MLEHPEKTVNKALLETLVKLELLETEVNHRNSNFSFKRLHIFLLIQGNADSQENEDHLVCLAFRVQKEKQEPKVSHDLFTFVLFVTKNIL